MKSEQLNTTDVVGWLRMQAKQLAKAADDIEAALGGSSPRMQIQSDEPLTAQDVISQMNGRKMRIGSLAKEMSRSESQLKAILTEENGFTRGLRAWYTHGNSRKE